MDDNHCANVGNNLTNSSVNTDVITDSQSTTKINKHISGVLHSIEAIT